MLIMDSEMAKNNNISKKNSVLLDISLLFCHIFVILQVVPYKEKINFN